MDVGGWPGAFAWGLVSGALLGPLLIGAAFAGYRVGYTGRGFGGFAITALGLLAGSAVAMVLLINGAVKSGCPSCVDAFIVAPAAFFFLLGPLAIGYWLGRRSYDRWRVSEPD
ncbi:MAG: hypothetical protein ABIQ76_07080 [Candidatus Limnocylindrales bacterium]